VYWTDGNLVNAISFDLDKRVWFGNACELSVAAEVAPKRERGLWPSAVAQPTSMVRFHTLDAEQVKDCALHPQSAREELSKTGIGWIGSAVHFVFHNGDAVGLKISNIHTIMIIAIAVIGAPES
jgi:hypothetical protein